MALTANVVLSNFHGYNLRKFDVYVGQSFRVVLEGASQGSIKDWYSNRDQLLEVTVSDDRRSADIKALALGKIDLQIQSSGNRVELNLDIEVFDDVPAFLNPTASAPEMK